MSQHIQSRYDFSKQRSIFRIECEIKLEEILLRYRRDEIKQIQDKKEYLQIPKLYCQMNEELENLKNSIIQMKQSNICQPYDVTELSYLTSQSPDSPIPIQQHIMVPTNAPLPSGIDVLPLKNIEAFNQVIPTSKLPQIIYFPFGSKQSLFLIEFNFDVPPKSRLPKPPITSISQMASRTKKTRKHDYSITCSDEETESNTDTETLVSSCSDTIEEVMEMAPVKSKLKKKEVTKPKKRVTKTTRSSSQKNASKQTEASKKKQNRSTDSKPQKDNSKQNPLASADLMIVGNDVSENGGQQEQTELINPTNEKGNNSKSQD
ncbi:Uncharacterized protein QTN25_006430 [Entamoeba marina]